MSSDLRPNLFYQNGFISNVNECLCCIELNSKLKCALDEISSLNLIIQFLLNERKPVCASTSLDIDLSTLCENANKTEDHNVSICKDWIEVNSKHRGNSNNFRNLDSLLAYQPISTPSCYAHLINLQDSTESVNNTIVSNELGLHRISQRVDQQMEVISKETNCFLHIPTILNGKIYVNGSNNLVNCVIKRNVRHGDEISANNFLSTVNIRMQTSIKRSSKVVILGDSHLKGCTEKINNYLLDTFTITGWTKPGALAEEILDKPTMDLMNLNKRDVIMISAGANDVYMNNSNVALLKITKFIQNNCNTNIILYGVPHRYDLAEYSCVNSAIQAFNCKLRKVATCSNMLLYWSVTITESILQIMVCTSMEEVKDWFLNNWPLKFLN